MVGRLRRWRGALAVVGLVVASVGVTVVPVAAADDVVGDETGAALAIAGDLVLVAAALDESDSGFTASVAGSQVELPVDPQESLVLDAGEGEVAVELPTVTEIADGRVDESGAVVYESESSPVSLAAQATADGGMQVMVVIGENDAPLEYRFGMTLPIGSTLQSTADGGAAVFGADGSVVSTVAPPWAIDAYGQSVPTHYRIEGTSLVQVIEHRGFSYPVIGDPCWSCIARDAVEAVKSATSWAAGKVSSGARWLAGGVRTIAGKGKVFATRIGPWGLAACLGGAGWAWYRSDAEGWVRVGDAVMGCIPIPGK